MSLEHYLKYQIFFTCNQADGFLDQVHYGLDFLNIILLIKIVKTVVINAKRYKDLRKHFYLTLNDGVF